MGPYLIQLSTLIVVMLFGIWSALVIVGRYELHGRTAIIVALSPLVVLLGIYMAIRRALSDFSLSSITFKGLTKKNGRKLFFRETTRFEFYPFGSLLLPRVHFPGYSFIPAAFLISAQPEILDLILAFIEKSEEKPGIIAHINLGFRKQRNHNAFFLGGFGCLAGAAGWFLMGRGLCIGLAAIPIAISVFRLSKPALDFESVAIKYKKYRINRMRSPQEKVK